MRVTAPSESYCKLGKI